LLTHNAKWQPKGLAFNPTLAVNLYHWVGKGQSFHDSAIFSGFKNRKTGSVHGIFALESNSGKSRTGSFEDGILYSAKEPGR